MADDGATAYAECIRYLFSNADYSGTAKRYQNPTENWARFDALLQKLGRPALDGAVKIVHIAGTNGKGTTSALCDAMLRAGGARVGLFTSPHLHSFRERIRVDGKLVSREAVVAAVREVRAAVDSLDGGGGASPFEKLTAAALVCFKNSGVEWAVLETGLGGRWDCTNHCAPAVCGVTKIGLDHMNVLGSTVEAIAGEKAGIIKAGVAAFAAPQEEAALAVLRAAATKVGTTLRVVGSAADGGDGGDGDGGTAALEADGPLPRWLQLPHQRLNAALASAMLSELAARGALAADDAAARHAALRAARWPARFESLRPAALGGAELVVDVAHNEPAVGALLSAAAALLPAAAPRVLIFGANSDKDVAKMLKMVSATPHLVGAVAVCSGHPKAMKAEEISTLANGGGGGGPAWTAAATMEEALTQAAAALRQAADAADPPPQKQMGTVLCFGSVFVAAAMREALAKLEPALFQEDDWVFEGAKEPPLVM